jgi:hypothetical protein
MPATIKKIQELIPEKVNEYYQRFPYEVYAEPVIRKKLIYYGIRENQIEYQECYSAAMEAYMYSIHRCALKNYEHVEFYIRKMIALSIIWGIVISHENRIICKENGFRQVELDALGRYNRW